MLGYQVLTANNGAEAVAICAQRAASLKLVITDMMMPIMDGPATTRALRMLSPSLKIIASSGMDAGTGEADFQKLCVNAFLQKPFSAETLARTVHQVLGEA
jgi:two-component system cell cycle sensor histidine kinase/response regulator CckA